MSILSAAYIPNVIKTAPPNVISFTCLFRKVMENRKYKEKTIT